MNYAKREETTKKRAKVMSSAIKQLITFRALDDMGKDRQVLAVELIAEIKDKFPKEITPAEETLIKKISEARNQEVSPFDKPWHMGTSNEFPLPAESIPYILKVQALEDRFGVVTIRQAHWIARLCAVIKDIELLNSVSWRYSLKEKISQISNTPFNTSEFDKELLQHKSTILEVLERDFIATDSKLMQRAFEKLSDYKLAGVSVLINTLFVDNGKIWATTQPGTKETQSILIQEITDLKEQLIKEKAIKKIPKGTGYLILKTPIQIDVPINDWLQIQNKINENQAGEK